MPEHSRLQLRSGPPCAEFLLPYEQGRFQFPPERGFQWWIPLPFFSASSEVCGVSRIFPAVVPYELPCANRLESGHHDAHARGMRCVSHTTQVRTHSLGGRLAVSVAFPYFLCLPGRSIGLLRPRRHQLRIVSPQVFGALATLPVLMRMQFGFGRVGCAANLNVHGNRF